MSWRDEAQRQLEELRAVGRYRQLRPIAGPGPQTTLEDGTAVVSFASNDYLGLSTHPEVIAAGRAALATFGAGAGASRLITGSRPLHQQLEADLAAWKGTERALLFPTGFAANLGVLSVFGGPGVLVCSDELNHASIVDGCRLARGDVAVYGHLDVDHVADLLEAWRGPAVVVTDTVFSMDGDEAPVAALAEVCAAHGALLVLDEAHAVLGPPVDRTDAEVLRVGTLSKMLGSLGGFVAGPSPLIELVLNRARPFIFTTAPTPADTAAAAAALRIVQSPEGRMLEDRLGAVVGRVRAATHTATWRSPIVPIVVGSEGAALRASDRLLARGLLVPAIRPPTVPANTSRLRVALSAAHTDAQVDALLQGLAALTPQTV